MFLRASDSKTSEKESLGGVALQIKARNVYKVSSEMRSDLCLLRSLVEWCGSPGGMNDDCCDEGWEDFTWTGLKCETTGKHEW